MCEFKLRIVVNKNNNRELICKDAINIKWNDNRIYILRENGSLMKLDDYYITEVDAESQIVLLTPKLKL